MSNPRSVINAITANGETVGEYHLSEVTFVKVAILEKIGSPIITGEMKDCGLQDLFQTLFVLAHSPVESILMMQDESFFHKSIEWANEIPMKHYSRMMEAVKRIAERLEAVAPQGIPEGEGGKKKLLTDG